MDWDEDRRIDPSAGVYDTPRAAALSGVPVSRLHYWARKGIYVPGVEAGPRTRLWSWGDLLGVRAIAWFRARKGSGEPPRVSMHRIRAMLTELEASGISQDQLYRVVAITEGGDLTIRLSANEAIVAEPGRQTVMPDVLPLVRAYGNGPDLFQPRPLLRIIPDKLHGEPHLAGTRIASAVVYEYVRMGYPLVDILDFYPDAELAALEQAIDFERSLPRAA